MFSEEEKHRVAGDFKKLSINTELSYETWVHKKVYDADYLLAIPEGKKAFAWFTQYKKQNVCFLLEMTNKEVTHVKLVLTAFHEKIAYGSIFYGTTFYYDHNPFFCIEDVLQYKSKIIPRMTQMNEKLTIYKEMFINKYLKQESCIKNQWIFGLPLMSKKIEDLTSQINCIPYKINYIQFLKENKKLNLDYSVLQNTVFGTNTVQIRGSSNDKFQKNKQVNIDPNKKLVFRVTAHVQNDIYNLFVYNPHSINNDKFDFYDVAYIPDYKTSVFMNGYFRNIKENKNLDALEESDDEEEFQDERPDKFVYLDKKYNMTCKYNNKFRRWVPFLLSGKQERVITKTDLNQLIENGEQHFQNQRNSYPQRAPQQRVPQQSNQYSQRNQYPTKYQSKYSGIVK